MGTLYANYALRCAELPPRTCRTSLPLTLPRAPRIRPSRPRASPAVVCRPCREPPRVASPELACPGTTRSNGVSGCKLGRLPPGC